MVIKRKSQDSELGVSQEKEGSTGRLIQSTRTMLERRAKSTGESQVGYKRERFI